MADKAETPARVEYRDANETNPATIVFAGRWSIFAETPNYSNVLAKLAGACSQGGTVALTADGLQGWDSSLVAAAVEIHKLIVDLGGAPDIAGLPPGAQRLLALSLAVPERQDARRTARRADLLTQLGQKALAARKASEAGLQFFGETLIALVQVLRGRGQFRRDDFWLLVQQCGAQALPIVTVISLLVGMIFAFVGAFQLQRFAAEIFVANLVAVAMTREMGAVMTAIVLAGRTGAAFAAQIGSMQANEEVDALQTLGVSPMQFLVVPRVLALILMTPLLALYADFMGMIGGYLVGTSLSSVTGTAYIVQTKGAVVFGDFIVGLVKASVFGILIALAGCYYGMRSGRSAASVGDATTSAVVTGILLIIVVDAVFAVSLNILGL